MGARAKHKKDKKHANEAVAKVETKELAHLTKPQRALLSEALRRAEETRNRMEASLVELGRWILVNVFADDARAALENHRQNAVWLELLSRAGGPSLRLSRRLLYVGVQIAAHDKRIQDESWRLLEPGRKELLLPLGEEKALRSAAQHVVAMKLTQRATRAYVNAIRAEKSDGPRVRITAPRFSAQLRALRERFDSSGARKQVTVTLKGLQPDEKAKIRAEAEALREWASRLISATK